MLAVLELESPSTFKGDLGSMEQARARQYECNWENSNPLEVELGLLEESRQRPLELGLQERTNQHPHPGQSDQEVS
jgi:hypothetical protein